MTTRVDSSASSVKLLTAAIFDEDLVMAAALIAEGVSVHGRDTSGNTPMFIAAHCGKAKSLPFLALHGVNIDAPIYRDGSRPLYYAADGGHLDAVRALIDLGAMIDSTDNHGQTPLWTCAFRLAHEALNVPDKALWRTSQSHNPQGHTAVVEALILAGADVNIRPDTSEHGLGNWSAAKTIRDSGIYRLVDLLEGREFLKPKRSFWSALFG